MTACACFSSPGSWATSILVITDQRHPVAVSPGVRVIELNTPSAIETELSVQLPPDPKGARAIVRERLAAGGAALQRRLAGAYEDVVDAWSLGVTKVPAVVVDRRYVVYGVPDVNRAVSLIEDYRRNQP